MPYIYRSTNTHMHKMSCKLTYPLMIILVHLNFTEALALCPASRQRHARTYRVPTGEAA